MNRDVSREVKFGIEWRGMRGGRDGGASDRDTMLNVLLIELEI